MTRDVRWRRYRGRPQEQVANARDSFVDLTPINDDAAETTRANWGALLPGGDVPMIGERGVTSDDD